jgi:hypothetical protein
MFCTGCNIQLKSFCLVSKTNESCLCLACILQGRTVDALEDYSVKKINNNDNNNKTPNPVNVNVNVLQTVQPKVVTFSRARQCTKCYVDVLLCAFVLNQKDDYCLRCFLSYFLNHVNTDQNQNQQTSSSSCTLTNTPTILINKMDKIDQWTIQMSCNIFQSTMKNKNDEKDKDEDEDEDEHKEKIHFTEAKTALFIANHLRTSLCHLGYNQKIQKSNLLCQSILDLSLASVGLAHSLTSLKSGYEYLLNAEKVGILDGMDSHVWKNSLPGRRVETDMNMISSLSNVSPSTNLQQNICTKALSTTVRLYPSGQVVHLWSIAQNQNQDQDQKEKQIQKQKQSNALFPSVLLMGQMDDPLKSEKDHSNNLNNKYERIGDQLPKKGKWIFDTVSVLFLSWCRMVDAAICSRIRNKNRSTTHTQTNYSFVLPEDMSILVLPYHSNDISLGRSWDQQPISLPYLHHHLIDSLQIQRDLTHQLKLLLPDLIKDMSVSFKWLNEENEKNENKESDALVCAAFFNNTTESISKFSLRIGRPLGVNLQFLLQPFPYGLYWFDNGTLRAAMDATWELSTSTTMMTHPAPPHILFIVEYIYGIIEHYFLLNRILTCDKTTIKAIKQFYKNFLKDDKKLIIKPTIEAIKTIIKIPVAVPDSSQPKDEQIEQNEKKKRNTNTENKIVQYETKTVNAFDLVLQLITQKQEYHFKLDNNKSKKSKKN